MLLIEKEQRHENNPNVLNLFTRAETYGIRVETKHNSYHVWITDSQAVIISTVWQLELILDTIYAYECR